MSSRPVTAALLAATALATLVLLVLDSSPAVSPVPSLPAPPASSPPARLVGVPEPAARAEAERLGWDWRVVVVDGEPIPATADYRAGRLNAELADGVVVNVFIG